MLERIGSDFNLGLRVTGDWPLVLSRVRLIWVSLVLVNLNPINDTYIEEGRRNISGGAKHWDKWKLRTALEWVVFTSSRTPRLELTKVLDAGKNWKWFQFGLEGNGILTFGPKPGVIDKSEACFSYPQSNKRYIHMKIIIIIVSPLCSSSLLRVSWCV